MALFDRAPQSDDTGSPDLAAVKASLSKSKRRQSRLLEDADDAKVSAQLDALYAPENFERVASLYTDIRLAWTGNEIFALNDKERLILSHSLAAVMQTYGKIPPGLLAVIIFSANFAGIVGEKEAKYWLAQQRAKEGVGVRAPRT
jgi:hypothetical protein